MRSEIVVWLGNTTFEIWYILQMLYFLPVLLPILHCHFVSVQIITLLSINKFFKCACSLWYIDPVGFFPKQKFQKYRVQLVQVRCLYWLENYCYLIAWAVYLNRWLQEMPSCLLLQCELMLPPLYRQLSSYIHISLTHRMASPAFSSETLVSCTE